MHEYTIKAWVRPLNVQTFTRHSGLDEMVIDIECLAPYLSKDRESFCTSEKNFHMSDKGMSSEFVHSASITCVVQCDPIDEEDMLILLGMIASKHTTSHSIDCAITEEVQ